MVQKVFEPLKFDCIYGIFQSTGYNNLDLCFVEEMKSFTASNMEDSLEFTWSLFFILLVVNCFIGSVPAFAGEWEVGIGVGLGLFILEYGFLGKWKRETDI